MGQEMANSEMLVKKSPDPEAPGSSRKPVELSYTIEELLSFADLGCCKIRPENLDPVVWRDASASAEGVEGGLSLSSRGLVRREREGEVPGKSSADIPEWRKDSWRSGGPASLSTQNSRRKVHEEDSSSGIAFSTGYPPRPAGGWGGDNGHVRNSHDTRYWLQGPGSGRWDHRTGLQDRDREVGRPFQKWDGDDSAPSILPSDAVEGMRPFGGQAGRPGWSPTERDGLLGSGGHLHRTYTGNFTTMRSGLDRQMSMGIVPERQICMGSHESLIKMGPADRQMSMGLPPDRQLSMGLPPDRQMSLGGIPLERQMSLGHGAPERQLSIGVVDRTGRAGITRHPESYHLSRSSKSLAFPRRDDTDSNNDETFGSEDNSSNDRAEEERRRRESFESLRKDQQRLLHEKQQKQEERVSFSESSVSRKHDETTLWDDSALSLELSSSPTSRLPDKAIPKSTEALSSGPAPVMPRPAIPPGFDKRPAQPVTAVVKPSAAVETKKEGDDYVHGADDNLKQTLTAQIETTNSGFQEIVVADGSGKARMPSLGSDCPEKADSLASVFQPAPLVVKREDVAQVEVRDISTSTEKTTEWRLNFDGKIASECKVMITDKVKDDILSGIDKCRTATDHQGSVLDKWFGGVTGNGSEESTTNSGALSAFVNEAQSESMKEATWSGDDARMSKFAQWFPPEVSNQADAGPRDILSLFPQSTSAPSLPSSSSTSHGTDAVAIHVINFGTSSVKATGRRLPMPSGPSLEDIEKGLQATTSNPDDEKNDVIEEALVDLTSSQKLKIVLGVDREEDAMMSDESEKRLSIVKVLPFQLGPTHQGQRSISTKKALPVFRTCEDIEQSMLAEAGTTAKVHDSGLLAVDPTAKDRKAVADSAASLHILSLLHKGGPPPLASENSSPSSNLLESHGGASIRSAQKPDKGERKLSSSPKETVEEENPTLEAFFGKQFMNELRAVEAPLSATVFGEDDVLYPLNRQPSSRMRTQHSLSDANVAKQWPGPIGPLSGVTMQESNVLAEVNRQGEVIGLPGRLWSTAGQIAEAAEEGGRVANLPSRLTFWGNGLNSNLSNDGKLSSNLKFGCKESPVSGMDGGSFLFDDAGRRDSILSSKEPLNGLQGNPYVNSATSFGTSDDAIARTSLGSQLKLADDSTLPPIRPGAGSFPAISASPSQVSPAFKEVLVKGLLGDDVALKFGSTGLSAAAQNESSSSAAAPTGAEPDSILLAPSLPVSGKTISVHQGLGADRKGDLSGSGQTAESLGEMAFVEKTREGGQNVEPSLASAGAPPSLPENVQSGGLARANSALSGIPMRFKGGGAGGIQSPPTGFPPFQPVGPPLQQQHSLGTGGYRSDASTQVQPRMQPGLPIHPLHHHLPQQNQTPTSIPIFPTQQFHPQPALQPQLLSRTFSNGSALEFPHIAYGPSPSADMNRPPPGSGGSSQFPPSVGAAAQGHLAQPGMYHPMGPGAPPTAAHFLSSAQVPPRAAVVHPMADPRMFIQEQQVLHDPHGLGPNLPGPPNGPNLFPLRGHGLHSGQGAAIFHQPMANSLRGPPPPPQNQVLPGPAPWIVAPYSSTRNPTEPTGFLNGGVVGGPESVDRWFNVEQLSRPGSGSSSPAGFIPLSVHAENKMRFG